MSFHDIEAPTGFQWGSSVGAGFATIVTETASGHEFRVTRQSQGRHRFRLLKTELDDTEALALQAFQLGRRGSLHSFKIMDVFKNSTAADGVSAPGGLDQILGTGDGVRTKFQMVRREEVGGPNEYTRPITLPQGGTGVVYVNGAPVAFSLNSLGEVTLSVAAPVGQLVTGGCKFYVPVRFERDMMAIQADAFGRWSVADFDCVEVLNELEWPETWNPGGCAPFEIQASRYLALNDGKLQVCSPAIAISVFLPAPTIGMPGGDNVLTLECKAGSAGSVQIRDDAGTALGAPLTAGQIQPIGLHTDGVTARWILL